MICQMIWNQGLPFQICTHFLLTRERNENKWPRNSFEILQLNLFLVADIIIFLFWVGGNCFPCWFNPSTILKLINMFNLVLVSGNKKSKNSVQSTSTWTQCILPSSYCLLETQTPATVHWDSKRQLSQDCGLDKTDDEQNYLLDWRRIG